jgi:antirestriction protein ArdC
LANWLKLLKDDKKAIFTAASAAQKAVNFIHDVVAQHEPMKYAA